MRKNKNHILQPNDNLNMQQDFIFFDTETNAYKIYDKDKDVFIKSETVTIKQEKEIHKLKLGWALYWNKLSDIEEWIYFKNAKTFWDFVMSKAKDKKELIVYAHNMDFDFKIVDGIKELTLKRKWELSNFYIKGCVFMMTFIKGNKKILLYDTMNYSPVSLEKIGESLKNKKMEIDFKTCTDEELKIYCKNDVKIIYLFVKSLIEFLQKYELTKLKPTSSSIAMNAFRHKFYDYDKCPIFIHTNLNAIKLERDSYHGGITDCFKIGKFKGDFLKLDINSMYPYQMIKYKFPTKLVFYSIDEDKNLIKYLNEFLDEYHIIAECEIFLPKNYAYILSKFKVNKESRMGFIHGKFNIVLTTPEIEYVKKYGKILKVKKIAIYEKDYIFKEYIDFFYNQRLRFKKEKNYIFDSFAKYLMNGLYGKFGQHRTDYDILADNVPYDIGKYIVVEEKNGEVVEYIQMHIGNKIIRNMPTDNNAYDSFVAISSLVTAYARMYLIEIILKLGRENLFYVDTDSLIIKKEALNNIKEYLDDKELGKLKIEGESKDIEIIRPKWYKFDDKKEEKNKLEKNEKYEPWKCKGVRKEHTIYDDDENFLTIEQNQWERFNTSLKNKNMNQQVITKTVKRLSKKYDKGLILENHDVEPYDVKNVQPISI